MVLKIRFILCTYNSNFLCVLNFNFLEEFRVFFDRTIFLINYVREIVTNRKKVKKYY
jgi:hypothetical protein